MTDLIDSLLALLPGAEIINQKRQSWHSATFSGERMTIGLRLCGTDAERQATQFAEELPEVEFGLRRQFVADIVVSSIVGCDGGVELTVEALLLDE